MIQVFPEVVFQKLQNTEFFMFNYEHIRLKILQIVHHVQTAWWKHWLVALIKPCLVDEYNFIQALVLIKYVQFNHSIHQLNVHFNHSIDQFISLAL